MERIEQRIVIAAPIEQVFHFHDDTRNLLRITPPSIKVAIETMGEPGLGYEVVLKVRQFGIFTMRWKVKITEYTSPTLMSDEQVSGPFAFWKQTRRLRNVEGGTELTDIVEYQPPFGILGRIANALVIRNQVQQMFTYRQAATKRILESA
jgi:ligand-binding SRPBCC domain-containing protein